MLGGIFGFGAIPLVKANAHMLIAYMRGTPSYGFDN
jgi:hypothetical protein